MPFPKTVLSAIAFCLQLTSLLDAQVAPPITTLRSTPSCSACSIRLETHATLRLPDDSLSFGQRITAIGGGKFLAWGMKETPVPALMAKDGTFERLIARKGQGPGEISSVKMIALVQRDSVWVLDGARKHVFSPEMHWVRSENFSMASSEFLVAPNGRLIATGRVSTPERAGFPLHLLRPDLEFISSFGASDLAIDTRRMAPNGDSPESYLLRHLTPGQGDSFWAYNPTRFLLEQYDYAGKPVSRVVHALDGWYGAATDRRPSVGYQKGLNLAFVQASGREIIWLGYYDPKPGMVKAPGAESVIQFARRHDMVIEAVDLRKMEVIASQRFPGKIAMKIASGTDLIALIQPRNEDFYDLAVSRLVLVGRLK